MSLLSHSKVNRNWSFF